MANGILGRFELADGDNTVVYTVPEANFTVATINVCNKGTVPVTVDIAISDDGDLNPAPEQYIEYGLSISPKGVLERTGVVIDALKKIFCTVNGNAETTVVVYGLETPTS